MTAVTTPKAPSEPITTSRRSGPAALAGELPRSSSPCGVATGSPTTRRVEAAVAGRGLARGTGRPRSRRSRRTRRTAGSGPASARARPAAPRPAGRAGPARGWRSSSRCRPRAACRSGSGRARRRRRSPRDGRPGRRRPRCRRRRGPARRVAATHQSISAATSSWVPGVRRRPGESEPSPARSLSRSGVDLPRVRCSRVSWSVSTCSAPTISASSRSRPGGQRLAEPDVGGVDGGRVRGADEGVDERERGLRERAGLGRVAPARPVHLGLRAHVLQCDT